MRGEARIAGREIVAVPAVESDVVTIFMDLDAVAVEFYFMRPAEPVRRLFAERRETWLDKRASSEHGYLLLPPFTMRSGVRGRSGGRTGGSRSGKNAPQPSGHLADQVQCGQSPAS
jgi:hypothetical protein